MKNLYAILFFLFTFSIVYGQIVNIPDVNFKNLLLSSAPNNGVARDIDGNFISIDSNSNGEVEASEALAVYNLYVHGASINVLTGIEAFVNLRGLDCSHNNLTALPVSTLTHLDGLSFRLNQISSITDLILPASLTYIDAGQNPITSINISNLSQLNRLLIDTTLITEINLCGTAVQSLWCNDNPNLQSISVKNNVVTQSSTLRSTNTSFPPPLTSFIFSNLPALTSICYDAGEQAAVLESGYIIGNVTLTSECNLNCPMLGVFQNNIVSEVSIYPNPIHSEFKIESQNQITSVKIYNSLGQLVKNILPLKDENTIDVSHLSKDIYWVEINSENTKTTQQIVKL